MSMCAPLARGVLGAPVHALSQSAYQGMTCWQLGPSRWELSLPRPPQLSGSCPRGPEPVLAAQPGQGRREQERGKGPGVVRREEGWAWLGPLRMRGQETLFHRFSRRGQAVQEPK